MKTSLPLVRHYGLELRITFPDRADRTGGAVWEYPPVGVPRVDDERMVKHGVVQYDRALPDEVIAAYSLVPLHRSRMAAAEAIVELAAMTNRLRYVQTYEERKMGGETAALKASETASSEAGFNIGGQFQVRNILPEIRAVLIDRGLLRVAQQNGRAAKRRTAARNPLRAERYRDEDYVERVGEGADAYDRTSTRTITYPPRVSRDHWKRPDTAQAARIASRLKVAPQSYSYTRDGKRQYGYVDPLGSGNFGAAYKVEADDAPYVVKVASATNVHGRPWMRDEQTRNLRQEAGIANELASLGYGIIPRTTYVELDGGTPALVREYGEPLQTMTGAEYTELENQLLAIERKHGWRVYDELSLYRRRDGSIFVGDVGFWRAPSILAKGKKRREWRAMDSSLGGLLQDAQKRHSVPDVMPAPRLISLGSFRVSRGPRREKMDDLYAEFSQEFLDAVAAREAAGVPVPADVKALVRSAQSALAAYGKPAPRRNRKAAKNGSSHNRRRR